uniref:DUF630 domain-containing protein n=1 Tax=Ananas comosus var. bracteatus TaxID=296719 RepID=A0A6V7NFD7_ANACO|nr:unnamed protein product [Ananas comosus var. bracteatus]
MGCAQSRKENEEAVARCKEPRQWMRSAVSACSAFAASHFAYTVALKNTGASLSNFVHHHHHQQQDHSLAPILEQDAPSPALPRLHLRTGRGRRRGRGAG